MKILSGPGRYGTERGRKPPSLHPHFHHIFTFLLLSSSCLSPMYSSATWSISLLSKT